MSGSYDLGVLRIALAQRQPYLATAVYSLIDIETDKIPTMGVDKFFRLYYNPHFLEQGSRDECVAALIHELGHLLRNHHQRMEGFESQQLANIAGDCEINDDIAAEGMTLPQGKCPDCGKAYQYCFPSTYDMPDGQLAEWYYTHFPQDQQNKGGSGDKDEHQHGPDCGSGADGKPREWEHGYPSGACPGHDQFMQDMIRQKTAEDIQTYVKQAGTVPGQWLQFADSVLNAKVDWRKQLPALVRHAYADVAGMVDFDYRRPSRRHQGSNIVFPRMKRPVPSVAIVADTSGSMSGEMNDLMAEVGGILKNAVRDNGVPVIACDADVAWSGKVFRPSQVQLRGFGGTDMRVGLEYAEKNVHPRPQICVVITDGYTPWPDRCPAGMKVIVALIGKDAPLGPSWAKSVRVE